MQPLANNQTPQHTYQNTQHNTVQVSRFPKQILTTQHKHGETKMHAKTDSEVTSLAASSPTRSPPRRPLYYVQSPSRDSHDGEKTATTSFHSTPVLSPSASPPHSRHSSSTRFSKKDHSHSLKPWKQIDVIEEEGLLQGDGHHNGLLRRCYFLVFVVG